MRRAKGLFGGRLALLAIVVLAIAHVCIYIDASYDKPIKRRELRFLVSIDDKCAGAIISTRHVLTSSHCVDHNPGGPERLSVKVDAYDLGNPSDGRTVPVKQIFLHESFDLSEGKHLSDLAIIELKEELHPNQVIRLPDRGSKPYPGFRADVIGWDQTNDRCGSVPKRNTLPIVYPYKCAIKEHDANICVAIGFGSRRCNNNCGTLFVQEGDFFGKFHVLLGVSTFNEDEACDPSENYRLFTLVSDAGHLDWIHKRLNNMRLN